MEPIDEKKQTIRIEKIEGAKDVVTPFGLVFLLWNRPDLLGLYLQFLALAQLKTQIWIRQFELPKLLSMSYVSYYKKRKELADLKLIMIKRENSNTTKIIINEQCLIENIRLPYKKYKALQESKSLSELSDLVINTTKTLKEESEKISFEEGQVQLFDNIYINNSQNTNNINKNNNVTRVTSNTNVVKKSTYPKEDYELVLSAFKKYKGIGLAGPEISYHAKAVKMMFQANHKPKEIIDFMKWLNEHEDDGETPWVHTWTIWTVQKKISEFLGGKLEVKTLSDQYKEYAK